MKSKRTGKEIVAEVHLEKQSHKGTIAIVEGGNDSKIFKRLFNKDEVVIISSDGKKNAIEAIETLNSKDVSLVLCIVDSDFDNIENKRYCIDSLFYTDNHDLDLMIANSSALDNYLAEFGSEEKIKKFQANSSKSIFAKICDCLEPLSCCRLASFRHELNIEFSHLKFRFLDRDTLDADIDKLINPLLRPPLKPSDKKQLKKYIEEISLEGHDRCQLCNGHDFYQALAVAMRKYLGNLKMHESLLLEKVVRLAFDANAFAQTRLYADLKEWGTKNNIPLFDH